MKKMRVFVEFWIQTNVNKKMLVTGHNQKNGFLSLRNHNKNLFVIAM